MKTYEIHLDDSLAEKFEIALQLTGETADEAIAKLARTYLADTFSAAANSMRGENGRSASQEQPQPERRTARRAANQPNAPHSNVRVEEESQENFFSKAINRIPRGANKPNQHTHKIVRAFWELQDEIGKVTPEALRSRCSDPTSHPDTFVPHLHTARNNYRRHHNHRVRGGTQEMIALLLQLFWTFFIIGLFNFGGGGAMISLIQTQVVTLKGWISEDVFANIIAISQTTPGPIGINCATYVGYQVMADHGYGNVLAILGSLSTTIAVVLPSFIIFFALMKFYSKFHTSPVFKGVMGALTPVVAGMIGAAALVLMFHVGFDGWIPQFELIRNNFPDWRSWTLFAVAFALSMWSKISPIWIIIISGIVGILIF